jgi:hypothetical protein
VTAVTQQAEASVVQLRQADPAVVVADVLARVVPSGTALHYARRVLDRLDRQVEVTFDSAEDAQRIRSYSATIGWLRRRVATVEEENRRLHAEVGVARANVARLTGLLADRGGQ